ncbi:MAG: hypothetical protein ACI4CT_02715 [Lachnospiraceae bacterium]
MKQVMKKLWVVLMTISMIMGMCLPANTKAVTYRTVNVSITYGDEILCPRTAMTVSDFDVTPYGYDSSQWSDSVTLAHALIQLHLDELQLDETSLSTAFSMADSGWLETVWGVPASDYVSNMYLGYTVDGEAVDTTATNTVLKDGSDINLYFYRYTYDFNDYHTTYISDIAKFDRQKESITVGEPLTLCLSTIPDGWNSTVSEPIEGASITRVDGTTVTDMGYTTDSEGKAVVTFDEAGTYLLSAMKYADGQPDMTMPWCEVMVYNRPSGGSSTSSGTASSSSDQSETENKEEITDTETDDTLVISPAPASQVNWSKIHIRKKLSVVKGKKASVVKLIPKSVKDSCRIRFTTSDKKVVKLLKNGKLKAVKAGKATVKTTITAEDGTVKIYKTKVTVKKR